MSLVIQRLDFGREQFKVYEDRRYIGRVYQTPINDWFWSIDLLLIEGKKSIDGRAATRTNALTQLNVAWERLKHRGKSAA